ncbi:hypothetical protein OBJ95_09550 [Empedobacter falsenii]
MKENIESKVFDFFVQSNDFNGIPLRQISEDLKIEYKESIDLIKELVTEDKLSIISSTNPHIIGRAHYPIKSQLQILENAKKTTVKSKIYGEIEFSFENTEFPICLYPSQSSLRKNRNINEYGFSVYSKQLALGEPQLKPVFFDIEVLERYYNDPRFDFDFEDYSGKISCKYDELYNPLVRKEDDIYVKTFGVGFDEKGNRLAVVFLRYLHNLSPEHQVYWKSKERNGNCKVLKEYYENTIEGKWTFSYSIFSAFLQELKCLNEISELIFGIKIFNETFENEKRPKEFTFFFVPTLKNYHDFVHILDKMISDNINKSFFNNKIELYELKDQNGYYLKENKGTLRLLEEWLDSNFNIDGEGSILEVIKPFKKIRNERQTPAHKININNYDENLITKQKELISETYNSMRQLRYIFSLHHKARKYEIPNWLENGTILNL